MAASTGNVLNTLGRWSLTMNLVWLGLVFLFLFAMAVKVLVEQALNRDEPGVTFASTLKMAGMLVGSMAMVALVAWLMFKGLRSTSTTGRRFRQLQGVTMLLS